ncbi:RING finger domain protein [Thermoascus aurantiacus ATCC 26904]
MDSSGRRQDRLWQWPGVSSASDSSNRAGNSDTTRGTADSGDSSSSRPRKHYPPRICRICLESVPPTFHPPSEHLPGFLQPKPRVTYESPDPELGRLIRPCKCKGSSRYVHEGCLSKWRHADPDYGRRNYWQCPTCRFQYRLERVRWGRWISSTATQIGLTLGILLFTIFILGFVADPIINLYVDPFETIYFTEFWEPNRVVDLPTNKRASWFEHFVKGLASLGVLSFIKVLFALSPWQWWNLRSSGLVASGRSTGRSRVASISWVVVLIGVGSFLWGVYKGVRAWSRRALEKAGERVMDVPLSDDDDDEWMPSSNEDQRSKKED